MNILTGLRLVCLCVGICALSARGAESPATFKVGEFSFQRPAGWELVQPTSMMRAAQLKVPGKKKDENADVVFFRFGPGDGGGTQANVDRWLGQFKEPRDKIKARVDAETIDGRKVTFVQAEGTYSGGMMGHPVPDLPNAMLLGAILESKEGNVFIKMTGPATIVRSTKTAFRKMTEGALKEK